MQTKGCGAQTTGGQPRHVSEILAWERAIALDIFGTAASTEAADRLFLLQQGEQRWRPSHDEYVIAIVGNRTDYFGDYTISTSTL